MSQGRQGRQDRNRCRKQSEDHPKDEKHEMLPQNEALQQRSGPARRAQKSQLVTPFQHRPEHHHANPNASKKQSESSQDLKGVQIGVLNGIESGQPVNRG